MVSILILESIFCIFVCLFLAYLLAFLSFSIFLMELMFLMEYRLAVSLSLC